MNGLRGYGTIPFSISQVLHFSHIAALVLELKNHGRSIPIFLI